MPTAALAAAAILALVTALAGCESGRSSTEPTGPTGSNEATPGQTLRTPTIPTAPPSFPPDALTRLMADAAGWATPAGSDLDDSWRRVFDVLDIVGESPYAPPDAVIGYRAGAIPDTACAVGSSASRWRNNARYCRADARIVLDEDWVRGFVERTDDAAAVALLAHEWAHHVQRLLNVQTEDLREELQADCYAGMYLSASGVLPHGSVADEDGALLAAMTTFFELGNTEYRTSEWFGAQEHGSPAQRILATSTGLQSNQRIDDLVGGGMEKGLPWCFGYVDYEVQDVTMIGPYRFVELPGRETIEDGDLLVIAPETRTGQAGATIALGWTPTLPHPGGATEENLRAIWATDAWAGIDATILPQPLRASVHGGTGIQATYIYRRPDGTNPQAGVFGLVSPASGQGGLVVLASQPLLPTSQEHAGALYEDALISMVQVMSRLCTPDEGTSGPNIDPVCFDVQ